MLTEPVKGALRLAAVSREALALGLTPGLTLADARARIPAIATAEHDPAADAAMLGRMAEACERWTPLVARESLDGLVLDTTGCAHLFGGEDVLRERIVVAFRRRGISTRGALAGTPDAARALARFGQSKVVPSGDEAAAVRPLPVAALGLTEPDRAALALAGLKRIADLADLPSRSLAARFGEDLTRRLRRVLGREDRRITPLRPPPACRVEQRFMEPIAHAEAIERTLRDLIARAAALLETAGQGGRAFEASFFRTDGEVRRIAVETGRPSRDPAVILRLLHERLDSLADPLDPGYGFDLIRLAVPVAEPLAPVQRSLAVALPRGARADALPKQGVLPSPLSGRTSSTSHPGPHWRTLRGPLMRTPQVEGPGGKTEERTASDRIGVGHALGEVRPNLVVLRLPPRLVDDKVDEALSQGPSRGAPSYRASSGQCDVASGIESSKPIPSLDAETLGEVSDLVDRLVARFGSARVVRFVCVDTHDPVRASRLAPAMESSGRPAQWAASEPGEPPLRPIQLFEPPQLIETLAEVPDGPPIRFRWRRVLHRVVRAEGPERISAEWWRTREQPTRDYFRVEDENGRRFWLFRAGLYVRETDKPRWYLHGLFA